MNEKQINITLCDNAFFAILWSGAFAMVVSIAAICGYVSVKEHTAALAAGCEQVQKAGTSEVIWQKAK